MRFGTQTGNAQKYHPTYSPDVNPVENSFAEADDGMAKIPDANFPTTVRGCVAKFTQIYKNLRPEGHATSESYFLALADSMPARMQAVICVCACARTAVWILPLDRSESLNAQWAHLLCPVTKHNGTQFVCCTGNEGEMDSFVTGHRNYM